MLAAQQSLFREKRRERGGNPRFRIGLIMLHGYRIADDHMGKSKKDLSRGKANLKAKLAELEPKVKMDPLKKNRALHEEYEEIKRKLAEME